MSYLEDDPPLPPFAELFPHLKEDSKHLKPQHDPFTVTTRNGFLPVKPPLVNLPPPFGAVASLLEQMPIRKADGTPGLLAEFKLGPVIDDGGLSDLTAEVDALIANRESLDLALITALFRDYSFLASAYVLEPCWESWSKDHDAGYGLGRDVLPKCVSGPLVRTAKM